MSLEGRRVVVTRARPDAPALCELIASRGGHPILCPLIRIAPPEDAGPLETAVQNVETYDAIILGSIHAAQALVHVLMRHERQTSIPVACVGAKTAARLAQDDEMQATLQGPRWVPSVFRAEHLFQRIRAELNGVARRRFLYPRAPEGRIEIIDSLVTEGAAVDAPVAYRIAHESRASTEVRRSVVGADAWTFMSGNTLEAALTVLGETTARRLLASSVVATIGPVAAERAKGLGVRVDVVPHRATAEDLLAALGAYFAPGERPAPRSP